MSILYLIRHGQASFGKADYDDLSDLGRRQARFLGTFFLQAGIHFDACWSGTLRRQQQTADEVRNTCRAAGVDMPLSTETANLDEYDAEGVLRILIPLIEKEDPVFTRDVSNMLSNQRAFQTVFDRVMTRWASDRDIPEAVLPWSGFSKRVTTGIREIINCSGSKSQVAVFTSGGPIAVTVGNILSLAAEKTVSLSWQLVNASITRFKFSRGQINLATFNEYGHLEQKQENGLITYR